MGLKRIDIMLPDQLISVIIPTYNRSSLISDAIQSVLNQSHRNIEIIVVDDGSTDNTKTVVDSFKGAARYIVTDHRGPAHARNAGMRAAAGEYIAFLDSDTWATLNTDNSIKEVGMTLPMAAIDASPTDKTAPPSKSDQRTWVLAPVASVTS